MKIRSGFVANSSSSSFLVAFKTQPTSAEHLRQMLFGELVDIEKYDNSVSTQTAAETVWQDMQAQVRPPTRSDLVDELYPIAGELVYKENGGHHHQVYCLDVPTAERNQLRADIIRRANVLAEQLADEFLQQAEGGRIYVFSYSDNDGPTGATMEHWGIFRKLPHVVISNH